MELAFTSMNTPEGVRVDVLAKALEERGYSALFIGEHSHIPTSRGTPYPAGGDMPDPYKRMMDPFVSLTAAAMATERLLVGIGVCLVLEHHVLNLAKAVSTLDVLSAGRLQFGVGVGWNVEELANHRPDIPWSQRYRATEECVEALRRCWRDDEAEFHGQFFDFDPVWSYPKPLQQPTPPVLLGASGKLGAEHALRWADEWMPVDVGLGEGSLDEMCLVSLGGVPVSDAAAPAAPAGPVESAEAAASTTWKERLEAQEKAALQATLAEAGGNLTRGAELFGVPRTTYREKLLRHGLLDSGA